MMRSTPFALAALLCALSTSAWATPAPQGFSQLPHPALRAEELPEAAPRSSALDESSWACVGAGPLRLSLAFYANGRVTIDEEAVDPAPVDGAFDLREALLLISSFRRARLSPDAPAQGPMEVLEIYEVSHPSERELVLSGAGMLAAGAPMLSTDRALRCERKASMPNPIKG